MIHIHGYDDVSHVFGNTANRLEEDEVHLSGQSLLLLNVERPIYDVKCFPERTVWQLNFRYRNNNYSFFKITQKELKEQYTVEGRYCAETKVFVFSLTDKYRDNRYYKVVAQALM